MLASTWRFWLLSLCLMAVAMGATPVSAQDEEIATDSETTPAESDVAWASDGGAFGSAYASEAIYAPQCPGCAECAPQAYYYPPEGGACGCSQCANKRGSGIRGWIDGGFMGNTSSPNSRFNGPYNAVDRSNEPMANQVYVIGERQLPCGEVGWGGRIDLLYGEDFFLAQSIGMEAHPDGTSHWNKQFYGLAIPQAYVEYGGDLVSIKAGHFYTIVGYEGVPAPTNFFYSKSYSYQFGGPFTHWGALLSAKLWDGWELQAGLTNGWNALDRPSDRLGEIASIKYTDDALWTSVAVVTGDEFNNPAGLPGIAPAMANRTRYSWLIGLTPNGCWEYVFHQYVGRQSDGKPDDTADGNRALWYGIDQYLYYRHSRTWRSGLRVEWFRDQDGTRVGLNRASNPNKPPFPGSFYSITYGLNWTPTEKLILRPEIRADWFDGNGPRPFDDGEKDSQLMIGFDVIWLF